MDNIKTAEEAKAEIKKRGMTISKWAMLHNLPASVVYAVLKGKLQGLYGDGHRAAVLLGMKNGEIDNENDKARKSA